MSATAAGAATPPAAMAEAAGWQVAVVGTEVIADKFAVYVVELVSPSGHKSVTSHRYSSLLAFQKRLREAYPGVVAKVKAEFPRKTTFGALRPKLLSDRRGKLDCYLRELFSLPEISSCFFVLTMFGATRDVVFYRTLSVCVVCAVLERQGLAWLPARVQESNGKVYLITSCSQHHPRTLYCQSVPFFTRIVRQSLVGYKPVRSQVPPLGLILTRAQAKRQSQLGRQHATVCEVALHHHGEFVSDDELRERIEAAMLNQTRRRGSLSRVMLRLQGKLAEDMEELNAKIVLADELAHAKAPSKRSCKTMIELSHDRLIALCRLPSTALLRRRIFPCIKYYVRKGEELTCHHELVATISELSHFTDIHMSVDLCMEQPFADLSLVFEMLRRHKNVVRFITFSLMRPSEAVVKAAQDQAKGIEDSNSVDVVPIIETIVKASGGTISTDDFFSPAMALLLEPLLVSLGYGDHYFRFCPTIGAVTALLNDAECDSMPVTRAVDLERFVELAEPSIIDFGNSNYSPGVGITTFATLRKAWKQCLRPDTPKSMANLFSISLDASSGARISALLSATQFVAVRNITDPAFVDAERLLAPGEYTAKIQQLTGTF